MSKDDCFRDNLPQINVVRRVRIGHEMRLDLFFGYFVALSAFGSQFVILHIVMR